MRLRVICVALLCATILLGASGANAQTVRGTVSGTVTDPTGAVVPGAKVTLTHIETNLKRELQADRQGEFIATLLPAGAYRIVFQSVGFQKSEVEIELRLNQEMRLNLELSLPGPDLVVFEVTDLFRRDTSLGTVLENRKIVNLPLDGRNFFELSLLVPGTVPAAQGSAGSVRGDFALNVNGGREDANLFLLDGAFNTDPKLNGIGVKPPVDAIREFEVLTNSYDASFGRNASGQISAVLKGGSNDFHGTAYYFVRNDALDARNHFAPSGEPDPRYDRSQFGASLGGPIRKEKLFFFADYEGTILREGVTRLARVPTALERSGDFNGSFLPPPIDPFSGVPFPGNQIPQMFQHPIGQAIANLYPLPNRTTAGFGANYAASPTLEDDQHQFDARLDWVLGGSSDLTARYSFVDRDLFEPYSGATFALVPGFGNNVPRRAQNFLLGYTRAFSPWLLNEARFAWNRVSIAVNQQSQNTVTNSQVGIPNISANPRDTGLSFLRITGFSPLGHEFNNPQQSTSDVLQWSDQVSVVRGRHMLKFGGEYRYTRQNAFRDVQSRGFLNFLGAFTQNPLADLLLGLPTVTGVARLDNPQKLRTWSLNFFVQENYRIHPRVTLSAGLRYEFNRPAMDADDRANVYNPATGRLVAVGINGIPRAGYDSDKNNFAPRVGVAWTVNERLGTVVRAGYGIYYDQSALAPSEGLYFNSPFFDFNLFFSLPPQPPFFPGYTLLVNDPFPANFPVVLPKSAFAFQRDFRTPYAQHWNLSVQQRLGARRVLEVAYAGAKGTKLVTARDINQAAASPVTPNLRPNPLFDDITQLESRASSTYHALQARFQQSYDFGLSVLASYTWSKSLDDASGFFPTTGDANFPQDSNSLAGERARSNFDTRQRLSLSYGYDFPYCREVGGRVTYSGWKSWIFGGWSTFGIVTFQSGRAFTVALNRELDNSNTGFSIIGFGANDRPNLVGNPNVSNQNETRWFNTSAFATPAFGSFGNAGRNILDGPGLAVANLSLLKLISLKEQTRLQFRIEGFNVFNRTNYDLPDAFVGSSTFGQILSAQSPRRLQFGVKLLF